MSGDEVVRHEKSGPREAFFHGRRVSDRCDVCKLGEKLLQIGEIRDTVGSLITRIRGEASYIRLTDGIRHDVQRLTDLVVDKREVISPNQPRRDLGNCHRCGKPITDSCDHSFICNECLREED